MFNLIMLLDSFKGRHLEDFETLKTHNISAVSPHELQVILRFITKVADQVDKMMLHWCAHA